MRDELPYSNYPPGVTDDDPYFGESGQVETEAEYQSRMYHRLAPEPEHKPDCTCSECTDCPY